MKVKKKFIKVLIACSGKESRWGMYLGVHKHLIVVDGESLLHRTVRLLKHNLERLEIFNYEINIVSFHKDLFKVSDTKLIVPNVKNNGELSEYHDSPFLHVSKHLWATATQKYNNKTTLILFGDVYFTDEAINKIVNNITMADDYCFYGYQGNQHKKGEIYGVSFKHIFNNDLWKKILEVKKDYDDKIIKRFLTWEIYRKLQSIDLKKHEIKNSFIEIDDITDDFDFPEDYDKWVYNRLNKKESSL